MIAYSGKGEEVMALCLLESMGREWEEGRVVTKVPCMWLKSSGEEAASAAIVIFR